MSFDEDDLERVSLNGSIVARARFDYYHAPDGSRANPTIYRFADDWLAAQGKRYLANYALVRLEGNPGTDLVPGEGVPRGWLPLASRPVTPGQGIFMLHHGLGKPQMLEYATVVSIGKEKVGLRSLLNMDMPGAAGAPCCNEDWQVVAVRFELAPGIPTFFSKRAGTFIVIWARDLLADARFVDALNRHLPGQVEA